jgi:hypothetical protein
MSKQFRHNCGEVYQSLDHDYNDKLQEEMDKLVGQFGTVYGVYFPKPIFTIEECRDRHKTQNQMFKMLVTRMAMNYPIEELPDFLRESVKRWRENWKEIISGKELKVDQLDKEIKVLEDKLEKKRLKKEKILKA